MLRGEVLRREVSLYDETASWGSTHIGLVCLCCHGLLAKFCIGCRIGDMCLNPGHPLRRWKPINRGFAFHLQYSPMKCEGAKTARVPCEKVNPVLILLYGRETKEVFYSKLNSDIACLFLDPAPICGIVVSMILALAMSDYFDEASAPRGRFSDLGIRGSSSTEISLDNLFIKFSKSGDLDRSLNLVLLSDYFL
ncbi:hypothetical protein TIFTF001_027024 [Ficus carica]|uniref:Uncharacterized protein n=1 Tax=Ficus carica TaxID=3494 RepID=A0AA88DM76_FICCA|nr:hypothetical protein TIFTF001_027024 [Ficus carica]